MAHQQLTIYDFKEAIKEAKTFIAIGNTAIQKLYFKAKTLEKMYDNYRQGCRYGIEYLKDKPSLHSRDVRIIEEIIKN